MVFKNFSKWLEIMLVSTLLSVGCSKDEGEYRTFDLSNHKGDSRAILRMKFPDDDLKCARAVRQAAWEAYGIQYPYADAWNIRYSCRKVIKTDKKSLVDQIRNKQFEPGDLLGVDLHPSDITDMKGKPVLYTHVVLFLKRDEETEEPILYHRIGNKGYLTPISKLFGKKNRPRPVEILSMD